MSKESNYRGATDHDLLVALVPDIEGRLEKARTEKPELFEEIRSRAVDDKDGWRPLHWWLGCL